MFRPSHINSPSLKPGGGRALFLCGGMQSSGSTLLSWCFLQRPDMDGVLDARFDMLPEIPAMATPLAWCKITVACFRLQEVAGHFRDDGWDVRPLLLVRDVRPVFNSLIGKRYGRNGTTAEDPSIRLRCRRFLNDWEYARANSIPLIRFEDLARAPVASLQGLCATLGLAYHEDMVNWPKPLESLADGRHGNSSFRESKGSTLTSSIKPPGALKVDRIPADDLDWLESTFAEFNAANGYLAAADRAGVQPGRAAPSFDNTRHAWRRKNRGFAGILHRFTRAVDRRES